MRAEKRSGLRIPIACPVYYSNGAFHASGMTANLTPRGACLHGSHRVRVGMQLTLLLIPPTKSAFFIKEATVRWTRSGSFGVQLGVPKRTGVSGSDHVTTDDQHIPASFFAN